MRLTIQQSPTYQPERAYISQVLFREFLGVAYEIQWEPRPNVCIRAADGRELILADRLFRLPEGEWRRSSSLPAHPLARWQPPLRGLVAAYPPLAELPILMGDAPDSPDFLAWTPDRVQLGLDILGSSFFMLTRYEEVVRAQYDDFGRFLAADSLAHQEGFLDRPLVNDYLELLWLALSHLWPQLRRQPRAYQVLPTHDVDMPFRVKPWRRCARTVGGDVLGRRSLRLAGRHAWQGVRAAFGRPHRDEYDTFDWLMELAERHQVRCAFFLMTRGEYDLQHAWTRTLIRKIHARGHEIGLHPHPRTRTDLTQLQAECARLRATLAGECVPSDPLGGRQHYLSWEAPTTWQLWEQAGLAYDSTLAFADRAGFRCGTCYSFPTFNLLTRQPLKLWERPLLIMECSLFAPDYMNLDRAEAFNYVRQIASRVRQCQGEFRILWHNHWFANGPDEQDFYRAVLDLGN